jgi:hypothetical protein
VSAYSSAVLADSPKHYWRCADPGGVLLHDVGSQQLALMTNSNYPSGLPYTGPISDGGAFVSQGVAYAWFNEDLDANGAALSVELLLWQQADIATQQIAFVARSGTSVFFIDVSTTRKLGAHGPSSAVVDTVNFPLQTWVHVVATLTTGGSCILYKNAIQVATVSVGAMPSGNYRYALGGNSNAFASPWQGGLSECSVYNAVLTPTQVNNHYLAIDNQSSRPIFRVQGTDPSFDILNDILSAVRQRKLTPGQV